MSEKRTLDLLNLPNFKTITDLSELLDISTRKLWLYSMKNTVDYRTFYIPKRNGESRAISSPDDTLRDIQRWILTEILDKLSSSEYAMAFKKGGSYGNKQNAIYHCRTLYGLSFDLKDFFPSITADKIYTIFSSIGYNHFAATILTNLCTLDGKLPQGGPCSPSLSNFVCIELDKRLNGLCEKRGILYSRYADDMYFSCNDKRLLLKAYPIIRNIIEDEGFVIKDEKTKFETPSNKKQITGVTVTCLEKRNPFTLELKAPRKLKQTIRAEIYTCIMSGDYNIRDHILGEIAYVQYIERENSTAYLERIKNYIDKLGQKIECFPELAEAYNNNKFFVDSQNINTTVVQFVTDEEFNIYLEIFLKRKQFLNERNIDDICEYRSWPEDIVNISQEEKTVKLEEMAQRDQRRAGNNRVKAADYVEAAKGGSEEAQFDLATCFETGAGVPQSDEIANEWFAKAAMNGQKEAQARIDLCFDGQKIIDGNNVTPYSLDGWLEVAMYSPDERPRETAEAAFMLGIASENGLGGAPDYESAYNWFLEGATYGNRNSQYCLGLCYQLGLGVEQSYEAAIDWFECAKEKGDKKAEKKLDRLFWK